MVTMNLGDIATAIGIPEIAVRLILTLFAAQPLAIVYRRLVVDRRASPYVHHAYFTLTGLALSYFCYGIAVVNSLVTICSTYVLIRLAAALNRPTLAPAAVFLFSMGYLLVGYYFSSTDSYDINWTTPQCVLTLKLISIAYDWSDGRAHVDEHVDDDLQKRPIGDLPSLAEMYGYGYHFGSFQTGPPFPFKRYRMFTSRRGKFGVDIPSPGRLPERQLLKGILSLGIHSIFMIYVNSQTLQSEPFISLPMPLGYLLCGLFGFVFATKYASIWLLMDAANVWSGMSYDTDKEKHGSVTWDSMTNILPYNLLFGTNMMTLIPSINIHTNQFVLHYIYKRLRFLNSKTLSQLGVMMFLSIWHGFHDGYFVAFFLCELPFVSAERHMMETFSPYFQSSPVLRYTAAFIGFTEKWIVWGYGLLVFQLLHTERVMPMWRNLYYLPHIICPIIWVMGSPMKRAVRKLWPLRSGGGGGNKGDETNGMVKKRQ
ncbi:lysophospholipid acyltransferase 5-like [Oscarella lobularis]|uniref:lysophospholipid acyltransferase 5-like n=1 Tax=Oscarella lobularis TaxID=121494 RepID=UPI0033139B86